MNKKGIFWTKAGTDECDLDREPPFPSFNLLYARMVHNSSCYVNQTMLYSAINLYDMATDEILKEDKRQREQIRHLMKANAELQERLTKWEAQQGKGKRTSQKVKDITNDVFLLRDSGISNREIARRHGVSEGTIRRILMSLL